MKAFVAAVFVAIAVAVGASFVLEDQFQQAADHAFSGPGVRLSN